MFYCKDDDSQSEAFLASQPHLRYCEISGNLCFARYVVTEGLPHVTRKSELEELSDRSVEAPVLSDHRVQSRDRITIPSACAAGNGVTKVHVQTDSGVRENADMCMPTCTRQLTQQPSFEGWYHATLQ